MQPHNASGKVAQKGAVLLITHNASGNTQRSSATHHILAARLRQLQRHARGAGHRHAARVRKRAARLPAEGMHGARLEPAVQAAGWSCTQQADCHAARRGRCTMQESCLASPNCCTAPRRTATSWSAARLHPLPSCACWRAGLGGCQWRQLHHTLHIWQCRAARMHSPAPHRPQTHTNRRLPASAPDNDEAVACTEGGGWHPMTIALTGRTNATGCHVHKCTTASSPRFTMLAAQALLSNFSDTTGCQPTHRGSRPALAPGVRASGP